MVAEIWASVISSFVDQLVALFVSHLCHDDFASGVTASRLYSINVFPMGSKVVYAWSLETDFK